MKVIFLFLSNFLFSQDTLIFRSSSAGSCLRVPTDKIWELESVFISANDGYNIKISDRYFKDKYKSNDSIVVPFYVDEMELIINKTLVNYLFMIRQKTISY